MNHAKGRHIVSRGVRRAVLVCLAGLALSVLPALVVQADTIYVDHSATGAKDGTSWATAYTDLQDALGAAGSGDQIWVAEGTYKPTTGTARTATFQLKSGVALYGGYPNSGGQRDWENNTTILSGDLNEDDEPNWANRSDNCYHVVTGSGTDDTAVLDGFTVSGACSGGIVNNGGSPKVTNCTFSDNSASLLGGGMYNDNGSPKVTNCTFSDNSASLLGGGMYNINSSPTVTGCTFSRNFGGSGGGMYNDLNSSPTVTNCTFSSNGANSRGGGMCNINSSPAVTGCTFYSNSAYHNGGGIYNDNSNSTVTNCTFSGNDVRDGNGGGMYNDGGSPTLTNCTFSGNGASGHGGGIYNDNSNSTVTNCTFSGNDVRDGNGGGMSNKAASPTVTNCTFSRNFAGFGGGMCNEASSSPTLTNCTFSGNSADYAAGGNGGGMCNFMSSPTLTNCTFSGNEATDRGGGMYNCESCPTVKNTILAGNIPNDCYNDFMSTVNSYGYNLDSDGSCQLTGPSDLPSADPKLGPLQDNGGATMSHALLPGSPAIDAGSCTDISGNPVSHDQRGAARPFGSNCDIGAYEANFGDINGDGAIDLLDARLCAQISQGIISGTPQQRAAGDVDSDGDVDMEDAQILAEFIIGMRSTLP